MKSEKPIRSENPCNSKPISLYPQKPADALRRAMSVLPPPKEKPTSKRAKRILAATATAIFLLATAGYSPQSVGCRETEQQSEKAPEPASDGIKLKLFSTEPITHFALNATNRRVFETLGRIGDLKVTFADDFQLRPLSIDMTNVKVEDALNAAASKANVFWVPVAPDAILIVPDSPANRKKYGNGPPKPK